MNRLYIIKIIYLRIRNTINYIVNKSHLFFINRPIFINFAALNKPTSGMAEFDKIIQVNIEEQLKTSYIDYSMSVIVSRALPDVRDGLKPVHRRVLTG